ncbi:MAG: PIG-L deacetylase family protein [Candidatus Micrarchaeia archaeon]|jgi:LmbE family N-acetylglucosaminyl deacetylase
MDLEKILNSSKILIIAPHPDDEIIGCGGLILRAQKAKAKVHVLFGAVGKCRQLVTGQTDENVRLEETKQVAKRCGYTYEFMFVGDEFMRLDSLPQKALIDKIEDTISKVKPDIVVIPFEASYDQDHRAIFSACMTALRPTPQKIRHFVPVVLECEEPYSWEVGQPFLPNFYLDISAGIAEEKVEALKLHTTQYRKEPFARSGENILRIAQVRGKQAGVDAAEAYRLKRLYA